MAEAEAPSERTLEEMIGMTVRRVAAWSDGLTLEFEGGLVVEIEADAGDLLFFIGDERV